MSIGVNERDGGTIYNTQLLFDADGSLIQRRRKISPIMNVTKVDDRLRRLGLVGSPLLSKLNTDEPDPLVHRN